jgi:hypothetical protein
MAGKNTPETDRIQEKNERPSRTHEMAQMKGWISGAEIYLPKLIARNLLRETYCISAGFVPGWPADR